MIDKLKAWDTTYILSILFFVKTLAFGISFSECLGALVLLSIIQLDKVVNYYCPKRVDIYKELSLIQSQLAEMKSKTEGYERDLTALRFAAGKK